MSKPKSKVITVRVVGPLARCAPRFISQLVERGYTPLTRVAQLQVMQHLSKWMCEHGLGVEDMTSARVGEYLAQRRADHYSSFCSRAGLAQLLNALTVCGAPIVEPDRRGSDTDVLLADYGEYLRVERILSPTTIAAYVLRARRFITGYSHGTNLQGVTAGDVTRTVSREADRVSAGSAQFFVVALRAFLRWAYLTGRIESDLSGASLPVTGRRRSTLPRGITKDEARKLLASCDRRTATGLRDFAVIVLLLRLGLRSCEVAALRLDDIDWRAGQVTIRGKGRRTDLLPLPADVGEAIVAYLRRARPATELREVFLAADAPRAGLGRVGVSLIVRRACLRAGMEPRRSHWLRHALACEMVAAGVPLHEIGQVLRHEDTMSTSIYARVDVELLRTVAGSWPIEVTS